MQASFPFRPQVPDFINHHLSCLYSDPLLSCPIHSPRLILIFPVTTLSFLSFSHFWNIKDGMFYILQSISFSQLLIASQINISPPLWQEFIVCSPNAHHTKSLIHLSNLNLEKENVLLLPKHFSTASGPSCSDLHSPLPLSKYHPFIPLQLNKNLIFILFYWSRHCILHKNSRPFIQSSLILNISKYPWFQWVNNS